MNTSRIIEPEIIINPNTRKITVPKELYNIGIVCDDNSEKVKIRIPRYFDKCDFSNKTCTISYNNALKERGVYLVKDIIVYEDSLILYWYVSKHVTKKYGKIYFAVEFKAEVGENNLPYFYSTLPAEMNVLKGLDDEISIPSSDLSLYENLLSKLHAHSNLDVLNLIDADTLVQIDVAYQHASDSGKHIPNGGESGQVVGKDENGNITWIEQIDGSGEGTTDYIALNNKPSINGIQLIGDKSFEDLGLSLDGKVDKVSGMGLSTNDYTDSEQDKLKNMPNFIFSTTIPDSLDENTICFVYEE